MSIVVALHTFAEPHLSMVDDKGPLFTLGVHPDCAASLFALGQTEEGRGLSFAYSQSYYTSVGRERLIEACLTVKDLEAIVFIDGDMAFSPKDFSGLVMDGRACKGLLGGFYPSRQTLGEAIGTIATGNPEDYRATWPVPCTYVGAGFLWVPAGVYRAMRKPWVRFGWTDGAREQAFELEDKSFSRRVLEETQYKIYGRCFEGLSHEYRTRRSMEAMMVMAEGVSRVTGQGGR